MMEPVAYLTRFLETGRAINATIHKPYLTQPEHYGFEPLVPQSALSDAEARIRELEELARAFEVEANQMREVSIKNRHRAEAAEALLKEAGPIIQCMVDWEDGIAPLAEDFRAARAIHDKIGGGE